MQLAYCIGALLYLYFYLKTYHVDKLLCTLLLALWSLLAAGHGNIVRHCAELTQELHHYVVELVLNGAI